MVSSLPDDVSVFAICRFGIEIENFRTNASSRLLSRIAFGLRAVGEGCAASVSWREWGEPDRAHRNFHPLSPLPAGINSFQWRSIAKCRLVRTGHAGVSKSMLASACEFAQDELLGQTADDMQTQVYPKRLEYMPGITI